MRLTAPWVSGLFVVCAAASATETDLSVVVCAPGYPGNTEQAQPVLDQFASEISSGLGESGPHVRAVYHETLDGGLKRLEESDAGLAIVGLPFFLEYREALDLVPILAVEPASGRSERWSLVARDGAVSGPSGLSGWRIVGMAGFARRFVERVALADWGVLPDDVEIEFGSRVLAELRGAARGEKTAVLLDRAQDEAMPSLPFAENLQVVARSRPHVASLLCTVRGRVDAEAAAGYARVFLRMHEDASGREALEAMRIVRFETLNPTELEPFERMYASGGR